MAEYLSPGVYVEEFDSGMQAMDGVSTSTAGFVGMAEKGPVIGTPVFLTSFADYQRNFGGYLSESTHGSNRFLPYAVEQFFANGGARCFVMRVAPEDAKVASVAMANVKMEAKNPGKWGDNIKVSVAVDYKSYKTTVREIDESSEKKEYRLKNADGFEVGDTVVFMKVEGDKETPFMFNRITRIQDGLFAFENSIEEDVIDTKPVPKVTIARAALSVTVRCGNDAEEYKAVTFNRESPDFIENKLAKSELVKVICGAVDGICEPMKPISGSDEASKSFSLEGGQDGSCAKQDDGIYMGGGVAPGTRFGLESFKEVTGVSIMAIPGITSPAVQLALVGLCDLMKDRFAVLDMPEDARKVGELLAHRAIVDSSYAAMYHPWIQVYDKLVKKPVYIPPSGSVIGIYARSDNTRGVHKAPANEVVQNALSLSCLYNKGEQDMLNPEGVNLIRALPGQGIRIWGGRTCSSNALWKYVNVRRLFIFLEETIRTSTNWAVFEPNDAVLWMRVNLTITAFLRDQYRGGALVGSTESEAFYVKIGYPETMSQMDILNGKMICEIGVAPSRPAEFVIFRITQYTRE